MFAKYDGDGDGALTFRELFHLMSGNRNAVDPFGVSARLNPGPVLWLVCAHMEI